MGTLTTCPNCIEIAAQRTTPHGEPYTICPTCGAMMFEDTERDSEFYAAVQPPDTRHPTPDTRPAAKVNWSEAPSARLIPCEELRRLSRDDRALYRARLAALDESSLRQQAAVYASYCNAVFGEHVTTAGALACFRGAVAAHNTQKPASDDVSPLLFELALTDPCALAEFLRGHTDLWRQQLAWRYAPWLKRHGINVEWEYIAANWAALLRGTETDAGRAVDAQQCAAVES